MAIADVRYSFVSRIAASCITRDNEVKQTITDKIDKVVLHRWLGVPIFLAVMYLMFIFSINVGSAFIDFLIFFSEQSLSTASENFFFLSVRPNGLKRFLPTASAAVFNVFQHLFPSSSAFS